MERTRRKRSGIINGDRGAPLNMTLAVMSMHLAKEYGPGELPLHFRDLAIAYLESSELLCRELESGVEFPRFPGHI